MESKEQKIKIFFAIILPILVKYKASLDKTIDYYKLIVGDSSVFFEDNDGRIVNDNNSIYETLNQDVLERIEEIKLNGRIGLHHINNLIVYKIKQYHKDGCSKALNTPINPQITDAVTEENIKVLGEAPALAMALIYQTIENSEIENSEIENSL